MRVNNGILVVLCGLAAFALASAASAADQPPTDPQPVPTPTAPTGGGSSSSGGGSISGGGGGSSGTLTIKGGTLAKTDDTYVLQSDSTLALTGNGVLNFVATQPGAMVRAAYLGITTSSPDTALQKQLQLKAGVGLVVDTVEPDSPAEKAGVRQYDVLHKLDDQLLINADQFVVLVRSYEPGKEVKLSVIREGKPETLTAKLGERAVPPLTFRLVAQNATGRVNAATFQPFLNTHVYVPDNAVLLQPPGSNPQSGAGQITIDDGTRKLTISTAGGHKRMKGQDKSGKVNFDLAIDTPEDLDRVPPAFRKLYQDLPQFQPATAPVTPGPTPAPTPPAPTPQR